MITSLYILVTSWDKSGWKPPTNKAPTDIVGVLIIPGGVRQFYGQSHTTSGNLQGNFVIFAIKTNFAPHAHGTFPDFHKIFPKQITGNLIPQNREIYLTIC